MPPFQIRNRSAFTYAQAVIEEYSRSFTISSRLLPKRRRWAVCALYGFCRYAHNLIEKPRMRTGDEVMDELDILKKEILMAYRTGGSEHPVVMSFIEVASHFRIPIEYPLEFLKGAGMDVDHHRYRTWQDLHVFCYRVAGIVGIMMAYILGFKNESALPYAEKLGVAMQLTNMLRDVDNDRKRDRIYLPEDEMEQFSVTEDTLTRRQMNDALRSLMRIQVERAHRLYEEAEPGIALLDRESRFAIRCASRIYRGILYKIEASGYDPFAGRASLGRREKAGIVLREWMRSGRLSNR